MRIAVLHWTDRHVGGSSRYLADVAEGLVRRGHQLLLWHEGNGPADRSVLALPEGVGRVSAETLGIGVALAALGGWKPDVHFAHGFQDPRNEASVQAMAPSVFLAHDYYGTCISGSKTFGAPVPTPCDRAFGSACLVRYYPRRCGGLSPLSMAREYRRQAQRLRLLRGYGAIVTLSTHMAREYDRHGLRAQPLMSGALADALTGLEPPREETPAGPTAWTLDSWRLLYVGRLVELKGGRRLLGALPEVAHRLGCDIHLTVAGDGPARDAWEAEALRVTAADPRVRVSWTGWIGADALDHLYGEADLLVCPSVWPEPFGLVGLEAARHRLPVAAFAVGGIGDWLRPGINGALADADPPTSASLARAIESCLIDRGTHERLRNGAGRLASDDVFEGHLDRLEAILHQVSEQGREPVDAGH